MSFKLKIRVGERRRSVEYDAGNMSCRLLNLRQYQDTTVEPRIGASLLKSYSAFPPEKLSQSSRGRVVQVNQGIRRSLLVRCLL